MSKISDLAPIKFRAIFYVGLFTMAIIVFAIGNYFSHEMFLQMGQDLQNKGCVNVDGYIFASAFSLEKQELDHYFLWEKHCK